MRAWQHVLFSGCVWGLLSIGAGGGAIAAAAEPPAVVNAAHEQLHASDYEGAEASARAALKMDPEDGNSWQALADSLSARGRHLSAIEAYTQALRHGVARPLSVQMSIANLHRFAGRKNAARELWQFVFRSWRDGGVDDAQELVAAAEAALALGQGDPSLKRLALRVYEEAIGRTQDDPAAYIGLGALLLSSYNNVEAVPLFEKALQIAPQDPRALLAMARAQHFDHRSDAVHTARAAVALAPAWVDARFFLARVLINLEDTIGAHEQLEAALATNPRAVEALSLLAALRDRSGDKEAVKQLMNLVVNIAPGYGEGYAILAQMAANQRRYEDAVLYASRAVNLDAGNWRAHALIGMNQLRLGNNDSARIALEAAFRGDPFNVWTKNTLDLLDAMDGYAVLKEGRFILTGRSDQVAALAPYLLPLAEEAYDVHVARYGVYAPTPIRIEVHPKAEDLSVRTLGHVGVDLLGVSFGPTLVIDGPMLNPNGPFNWASVLWHELAHSFQLELSQGRAPRWLAEGMAVHDEHTAGREGWGQDIGPGFLQAWAEGRLAGASRLNERFLNPQSADDVGNAYLQAGLLVEMIDRDHGSGSLPALLAGYREGRNTDQLLDDVLGVSAAQFDKAFVDYMQQRFGTALAALGLPQTERSHDDSGPRAHDDKAGGDAAQTTDPKIGDEADDAVKSASTSRYAQLLRVAVNALRVDDFKAAEPALIQARALIPGHTGKSGPHRLLNDLYQRTGDLERLIESQRALVQVDADDLSPLLDLAANLQKVGDNHAAIDALQRALLIQPFDANMHEQLATLLESLNEWQAARVEREVVVALGASDPVGAQYSLAFAASRAGDPEAARLAILAALENAPLFEDGLKLLLQVRAQLTSPNSSRGTSTGGGTAAEERQQ
ncbi:MAG: tetratricopeptide (TPR) repeat protein [Gammaproteobacteria bacterium]|jgi:tetratricopeptide (TPR) repeat protein